MKMMLSIPRTISIAVNESRLIQPSAVPITEIEHAARYRRDRARRLVPGNLSLCLGQVSQASVELARASDDRHAWLSTADLGRVHHFMTTDGGRPGSRIVGVNTPLDPRREVKAFKPVALFALGDGWPSGTRSSVARAEGVYIRGGCNCR